MPQRSRRCLLVCWEWFTRSARNLADPGSCRIFSERLGQSTSNEHPKNIPSIPLSYCTQMLCRHLPAPKFATTRSCRRSRLRSETQNAQQRHLWMLEYFRSKGNRWICAVSTDKLMTVDQISIKYIYIYIKIYCIYVYTHTHHDEYHSMSRSFNIKWT